MKAKIKPRIDMENRTKLETVIPLNTPFILMVEPSDACNFRCKFCPSGDLELLKSIEARKQRNMEWDIFQKIANDMCEFENKVKVLRLYKDGEPLLNPRFADMVSYAKKIGACERVDTTTNASLLTHDLSDKIIEAGLDRINISIEGIDSQQYLEFSNYKIDYKKFVDELTYLYEHRKQCEVIIKISGDSLTETQKEEFLNIYGNIADGVSIESVMNCWHDFELKDVKVNDKVGVYGQPLTNVEVCPYVFYEMAINSDGTASVCFLDWTREMIIGDVKTQSVKEIWESDERYKYLEMFLKKERRNNPICSKCGQLTHGAPDNIDDYCDELLKRIKK
ncbi:MAG: radical SAM protein [Lachnospiraceae bacterium]|nr:radical SAM protein [Lachnospiraceae bacterium]